MYYKLVLPLLFTSLSWLSLAQNKYVYEANSYFESAKYCEGAAKCSLAYTKLTRKGNKAKKTKADMAYKTAECYRMVGRFAEANEWYERAKLLDYQKVVPEVLLYNADMLRQMGKIDKALVDYKAYSQLVPSDTRGEIGIKSCENYKQNIENKTRHVVTNQAVINVNEMDFSPVFGDRKETKMYFASSRPGSTGNETDPISCEKYLDIWVTELDKKGNWGEPKLIDNSGLINTDENEGTVSFDGRGKTMFFTRCPNEKKFNLGCDIWVSELKGKDNWDEPKKLALKANDSISVGHPCASEDGKTLIFASDMPGGFGGHDLWITHYNKKSDTWSTPVNLGPEINTAGNELFPTFGKDGSLIYSSDGLVGFGGLDMFKATASSEADKWENPVNLGSPLNSENDDYGLYEFNDRKGYFTSNRKNMNGKFSDDIYMYELPPFLYDLKLIVTEAGKKDVKLSDVNVTVTGSDGSTWTGKTNKNGTIFLDKKTDGTRYVNEEVTYHIAIAKDGYYENKKGSDITTVGLQYAQSFVVDMNLLPIKPIRLPEVRYPLNKWDLLVDSTINSKDSLLFVYNLLEENPGLVLELSSHTDSRGKAEANQKLSENRARACYKYLVEEKGVDPRRIVPIGKGENEPRTVYKVGDKYLDYKPEGVDFQTVVLTEAYINQYKTKNKTLYEYLHQLNRRTEGKVLSLEFNPETAPAANPAYLKYVKYP